MTPDHSFEKLDKPNDDAHTTKSCVGKKKLILTPILILLLIGLTAAFAVTYQKKHSNNDSGGRVSTSAIKSVCSVTRYKDSCITSLSPSNSTNLRTIYQFSLTVAVDSLHKLTADLAHITTADHDNRVKEALTVCATVLSDAVDSLNDTISASTKLGVVDDMRTWLSAAATNQETCSDALGEAGNDTFSHEVDLLMKNSTEFVSNSLAIATKIIPAIEGLTIKRRRLLGGFPAWVDRRLLQERPPRPHVTVAADGSGDVKKVAEAVAMIPKKSAERFVIYVKAGEYVENIDMDKSHWNVMIYGDGKGATIISGSKNFVDGTPTFATATFAITGKGFIGRDITFKNTAGPEKHQAVAFRSGSDQSALYRCSFEGFQDTLYQQSKRQFYRECDVTGTVDFIFGNAAVVLQKCNIQPRQPMAHQFVTITAQGKTDPDQNTGISIQRCEIMGRNLTAQTYLGRPWKKCSTTVVMETGIECLINPKGWSSWVPNVDPPASIFYAEYRNSGPGADTANRVRWPGYKLALTPTEASKYNVQTFIQGPSWLPSTTVTFDST